MDNVEGGSVESETHETHQSSDGDLSMQYSSSRLSSVSDDIPDPGDSTV